MANIGKKTKSFSSPIWSRFRGDFFSTEQPSGGGRPGARISMKWAIWRRLERFPPLVGVRETGPRNKRSHNLRILVLMPADFAIETADLAKIFRTRWTRREVRAVDGISLQVARGTTFGLLGPNGAGKTTFVKMLLSAVHPTAGTALIFGRDAREAESRRPIGYLPENH